jgi:hypothetical protein
MCIYRYDVYMCISMCGCIYLFPQYIYMHIINYILYIYSIYKFYILYIYIYSSSI